VEHYVTSAWQDVNIMLAKFAPLNLYYTFL